MIDRRPFCKAQATGSRSPSALLRGVLTTVLGRSRPKLGWASSLQTFRLSLNEVHLGKLVIGTAVADCGLKLCGRLQWVMAGGQVRIRLLGVVRGSERRGYSNFFPYILRKFRFVNGILREGVGSLNGAMRDDGRVKH